MVYDSEHEDDDLVEVSVVRESDVERGTGVWELKIYGLAHDLGVAAHRLSLRLPKYELYETGSQLRRAAKSVSANIVEGYGRRRYQAEYVRFLVFAKASLSETEEHLRYVQDCYPGEQKEVHVLLEAADILGRKLHRFMSLVETQHRS